MLMDLPSTGGGTSETTEFDVRIADLNKLLDELMRRYTEAHPDVAATRRLIAQLEQQKQQELEARRKIAADNPTKFIASTNPVYQRIRMSLADAEASVAASRARLSESEARLAQLKSIAGRAPQMETEMTQLNRDYEVLRKNYELLVSRRESATMAEDVDSTARMADFRIIDPPRISPTVVFPNRLALVPLVLALALAAGLAVALVVSQVLPTFHEPKQLRATTQRAVLGSISLQATLPMIRRKRVTNAAFAGGLASLLVMYGSWIAWVSLAARA